jgi:hypothetical protein
LTTVRAGAVVAAARERGLELSPGPRFSADGTLPHHLRLPFTPPPGTLDRVAAVLAAVCPERGATTSRFETGAERLSSSK